ncbi:GNAT family N-acetyltransferase [Microbacterium sp. 179-B 1A2 NHS]|uniref:GNAT family N-acetyltransferase n=1 Tax=Microbacterium sp. 179-B 1A2 NHS TaxID=3142383 RepID=UPI00399FB4B3
MIPLVIRADDATGPATVGLIRTHLDGMHAQTPPESVHALGPADLLDPEVTLWSAWAGERIAGIAALRRIDPRSGEVKSMRVDDAFLGLGVGRALLRHVVVEARRGGFSRLWLETGSSADFLPARRLYASEGFEECGPFGSYRADPLSTFMTLGL